MSATSPRLSANIYATAFPTTQIRDTIRPWSHLLDISTISLPISFTESTYRITQNLRHFRGNYTIVLLLILFLSLLFHPISIIVFLFTFTAWLYLYFFREEPIEIVGFLIDDRVVLGFLSVVTIGALGLTRVWWNVIVALLIGGLVVCLHAAMRAPEDVDDMESPYGALLSVVDDDASQGPYTLA